MTVHAPSFAFKGGGTKVPLFLYTLIYKKKVLNLYPFLPEPSIAKTMPFGPAVFPPLRLHTMAGAYFAGQDVVQRLLETKVVRRNSIDTRSPRGVLEALNSVGPYFALPHARGKGSRVLRIFLFRFRHNLSDFGD